MDLELEGRVVLITGGSKGIGLACARGFADEGARVAITSRSQTNLARAAMALEKDGFHVFAVPADLRDPAQAASMVQAVEKQLGRSRSS
jgi:NAD(P)-dependent dehydrogenase (short-subunit alcohol dehydrogenase family)